MTEQAEVVHAVIRTPRVFQVDRYAQSGVRARHAVVVADQDPFDWGTGRRYYDPTVVGMNVRAALGVSPVWASDDERIVRKLSTLLDPELVVPMDQLEVPQVIARSGDDTAAVGGAPPLGPPQGVLVGSDESGTGVTA